MANKAQKLFDDYVKFVRKHPELQHQRPEDYLNELSMRADEAGIDLTAVKKEVGNLTLALTKALSEKGR